ncbi:glycoside hydrolase family 88/105 protein [Roseisolibacter agri]|uniref:Glycoside hydrolase 105 family protein n=1 Tax=Roseisolibacter agri TaxID=2014610 RepID=A0AA37QDG9_9BACT|nr:glycoside hydrolase family 88 protein [Roseisolibacter agri]GLC23738.1 glycoside hydrolase 105 family protein [Roseisolibacter agri]
MTRLHTSSVLAVTMALCALAPTARAQTAPDVKHLPASIQLGEGSAQPNDAPLAIPHAPPRPRPSGGRPWSARVAESVMRRNPQVHRRWDYTAGVVLGAIEKVGQARRDTAMLAYVQRNMDRFVKADGSIDGYEPEEYNLDHVAPGRVLLSLHERTKDARYRQAADRLRAQLRTHPRTSEGGFWHKQVYPQQMWLDGLFMAQPFAAQYARSLATPAARDSAFDDVARQFLLVARHTRDPRTNLMYHGWDAARAQKWADSATGLSPNVWGRAMGWYVVAVVETLDHLPSSHPDRAAIVQTLRDAADGIARVQDPVTGLWWDVMDQPNRAGNYLEASASSMFAYALAKGARLGYLDARYRRVAERGFDGLLSNLVRENPDGTVSLINVVQVSGLGGSLRRDGSYRDGSFAYYVSEPVVTDDYKGVGPFILAALELGR